MRPIRGAAGTSITVEERASVDKDIEYLKECHYNEVCSMTIGVAPCSVCKALDRLEEKLHRYAEGARNSVNFIRDYYDAKVDA